MFFLQSYNAFANSKLVYISNKSIGYDRPVITRHTYDILGHGF